MAWIDYEKANDMVPHSWIIDCLETGINEKIRRLGRKYEIMVNRTDAWRGKSGRC